MDGLRPRADSGFISRLMLFLAVSVLCGLLVAGVALPIVGGLGLAARDSAEGFDSLPAELEIPPLPERSRILASDGSLIATFYEENRISVPISEVAPVMRKAVVAIEDSRFYEHGGIDVRGTLRAFVNNQSGEDVQGGSTLTQQYVKQVLLEAAANIKDEKKRLEAQKAATAQSYTRKLRELRYAVALEEQYTKQQILERYLNIAYFGAGAYGVEAAAKRYFNIHARDLTLAQAALLAGIVQQPTAFDPTRNPERALARRNIVLRPDGRDRLGDPAGGRRGEGHRPRAQAVQPLPAERLPGLQGRVLLRLRAQDHPERQELRRASGSTGPGCCCAAVSPSPRPSTPTRSAARRSRWPTTSTPGTRSPPPWCRCSPAPGRSGRWRSAGTSATRRSAARSSSTRPPTGRTAAATASRPARRSSRSWPPRPWRRATRSATRSTRRTRPRSATCRAATRP